MIVIDDRVIDDCSDRDRTDRTDRTDRVIGVIVIGCDRLRSAVIGSVIGSIKRVKNKQFSVIEPSRLSDVQV